MYKKKLIEVALPLDAINREAAREKSIRHGHPSTLHLWWARRPLAACRAVLFSSLVDDPSAHPDTFPTEEAQAGERQRLFRIIEDLVKWENSDNPAVLEGARAEIYASCDGAPPPVLDPFAGGGSIPLEAQRLGLEAHASDLNPVPVIINKALIEIPPRFAGRPPLHGGPDGDPRLNTWTGAQGLAEDVRYYGQWLRDEAQRRIGRLYPKVALPARHGGGDATVIAWLWARTVRCPNPACSRHLPLISSFALSARKGTSQYLNPTIVNDQVHFAISASPPSQWPVESGMKRGMSGVFECVFCAQVTSRDYVASEGLAGRLGVVHLATVVANARGRLYLTPDESSSSTPEVPPPGDTQFLEAELSPNPRDTWCRNFGLLRPLDLFTNRQLVTLTTLAGLVDEARDRVLADANNAGMPDDVRHLRDGGEGATAYSEAVSVYLGLAISRLADTLNSLCSWSSSRDQSRNLFARQAIPMVWDFCEVNPFAGAAGDLAVSVASVARSLAQLPATTAGIVDQRDARTVDFGGALISTDPPYYDNIGYADLSDFFYVWLRRSLSTVFPEECSTLLVPKAQELVATPYRFGGNRQAADDFFEDGLGDAFKRMHALQHPDYPLTVYYAFKQAEATEAGVSSTGWETMLQSLLDARFVIDGTWPLRTERASRSVSIGTNALASSIVLVCRPRDGAAPLATRKEFVAALKAELRPAVRTLQQGNIAPVDLAQAAIGPGMAVFSRYARVLEADGGTMRVRTALELINQVLDEAVAGTDADFDAGTRWAVTWFEDCGMTEGAYGRAEQLSKSRNTSVPGLAEAGIVIQRPGKVRLVTRDELSSHWDPATDSRLTVWEVAQHLINLLEKQGEPAAATLLHRVGPGLGETAKELAYRLYLVCERKGWSRDAMAYNALVSSWPELTRLAAAESEASTVGSVQTLFPK